MDEKYDIIYMVKVMKKRTKIIIAIVIILLLFEAFLSMDDTKEKETNTNSFIDFKKYMDESEEERTYNGVVYEKAFSRSISGKYKHGSRTHTYYYLVDEQTKKVLVYHNYYNKSYYSGSTEKCDVEEGKYVIDEDGEITITVKNKKSDYKLVFNKNELEDGSVQNGVYLIDFCLND